MAPVVLLLWVGFEISVILADGCLEDAGLDRTGQAYHIDRPLQTGVGGLLRIMLVVDQRRQASRLYISHTST
jgi:hypothetical protein